MSVWTRIPFGSRLLAAVRRASADPSGDRLRIPFALLLVALTLWLVRPLPGGGYGGPAVPAYVFPFAALGALTYALTSLTFEFEKSPRELVQLGLRVVAALPLSAGVFLLLGTVASVPDDSGATVAGVAFLTGLYVKLALKALGAVASRLYGSGETDPGRPGATRAEEATGDDRRSSRGDAPRNVENPIDERRRERIDEALTRVESLLAEEPDPEAVAVAAERLERELSPSSRPD